MKTSSWRLFPPQYTEFDKGHGRLETRRIWTSTELVGYSDFPYLSQAFRLERIRQDLQGNPLSSEIVFGVTSLTPPKATPQRVLSFNRNHWSIENRLHYVRDVTFDEDRCRIRKGQGPHIMASLRNLAISLLRLARAGNIAQALRSCAYNLRNALRLIGMVMA